MSINYQIHNITHSLLFKHKICDLNILYNPANSIFDIVIKNVPNTIFIEDGFINSTKPISYGLSIINNPVHFAQNIQIYKKLYTNHILFFHKELPPYLKKEDIFLINNDIDKYPKYTFCKNMTEIKNIKHINYGLKSNLSNTSDRSLDVIILYSTEEKQANILKNIISSNNISCEILCTNNLQNIDSIKEKLNNVKICIDTTDYYNVLFSVSCGCYGMTSIMSNDIGFIDTIDNFQNCLSSIKNALSIYNLDYITKTQNYISEIYNYQIFLNKIESIILENYKKAVLL